MTEGASYGPTTSELDQKAAPEPVDCKQMYASRYITIDGQILKLSNGEESKIVYTSHGEIQPHDGWCKGAYFERNGVSYLYVVEVTEVSCCFTF